MRSEKAENKIKCPFGRECSVGNTKCENYEVCIEFHKIGYEPNTKETKK